MGPAGGRSARLARVLTNRKGRFVIVHVTRLRAARPAHYIGASRRKGRGMVC